MEAGTSVGNCCKNSGGSSNNGNHHNLAGSSVMATPPSTPLSQLTNGGRVSSHSKSDINSTPTTSTNTNSKGGPRLIVDFSDLTVPVPFSPRILQPEELRRHFLVSLEKMFTLEPESLPFRQPVDPQELGIPDYSDIIRKPMDLQTIRIKMNCLKYTDPWMFVDDVLLMFDNALVYNRPTSRVWKYCMKLAEIFQQEINPVMQRLGYKHGRIHQFNSQTLSCFGRPVCMIGRNAPYYNFLRFHLCEKCYSENLIEDGVKLPWQNNVTVNKENFIKLKNDSENSYSPAAEMHRSYMRDAEMSRQLVIREFLRLLYCSKTTAEKKGNILKMLKLNSQLRIEFLNYFRQQEVHLSTEELQTIRLQLSRIIKLEDDENIIMSELLPEVVAHLSLSEDDENLNNSTSSADGDDIHNNKKHIHGGGGSCGDDDDANSTSTIGDDFPCNSSSSNCSTLSSLN